MEICVDFDGTVVDHAYPSVGVDVPGAVDTLKLLVMYGHKIILYTMRSDKYGSTSLQDAIDWYGENGIPLYGVQVNPTQHNWTTSPKCYGQLYIDDAAFGAPLINIEGFNRPCVDWTKVIEHFFPEITNG